MTHVGPTTFHSSDCVRHHTADDRWNPSRIRSEESPPGLVALCRSALPPPAPPHRGRHPLWRPARHLDHRVSSTLVLVAMAACTLCETPQISVTRSLHMRSLAAPLTAARRAINVPLRHRIQHNRYCIVSRRTSGGKARIVSSYTLGQNITSLLERLAPALVVG